MERHGIHAFNKQGDLGCHELGMIHQNIIVHASQAFALKWAISSRSNRFKHCISPAFTHCNNNILAQGGLSLWSPFELQGFKPCFPPSLSNPPAFVGLFHFILKKGSFGNPLSNTHPLFFFLPLTFPEIQDSYWGPTSQETHGVLRWGSACWHHERQRQLLAAASRVLGERDPHPGEAGSDRAIGTPHRAALLLLALVHSKPPSPFPLLAPSILVTSTLYRWSWGGGLCQSKTLQGHFSVFLQSFSKLLSLVGHSEADPFREQSLLLCIPPSCPISILYIGCFMPYRSHAPPGSGNPLISNLPSLCFNNSKRKHFSRCHVHERSSHKKQGRCCCAAQGYGDNRNGGWGGGKGSFLGLASPFHLHHCILFPFLWRIRYHCKSKYVYKELIYNFTFFEERIFLFLAFLPGCAS